MPYRFRRRRPGRRVARRFAARRRPIFRRRRFNRRARVPRGVSVLSNIPKTFHIRYSEYFNLTSTTGDLSYYVLSANNIYDPNVTGIGHQPLFHDTLQSLYKRYVVLGSKITFKYTSSSDNHPTMMGCLLCHTAAPAFYNNYTTIVEQGLGKYRLVNTGPSMYAASVSNTFSGNKFFNTKVASDMETFGADFGYSPIQQAYYICWIQDVTRDTQVGGNCTAVIDYIVKVAEPLNLSQS